MSVTSIARLVTETQLRRDDARWCIECGARACRCVEHGAYPPTLPTPPSPYSTLCYVPMPEASISLCREEELQGLQKRITLENKAKARTPCGVTEEATEGVRGWLRLGVTPIRPANRSCRSVIGTRVRKHPSGKSARPVLAGLTIRSLRGEPAMTLAPAVIFTDPCRHARRHAQEHACSVLITEHRSGAITPSRQPVRSVTDGGDGGCGKEKRSVPPRPPLYVHCGQYPAPRRSCYRTYIHE